MQNMDLLNRAALLDAIRGGFQPDYLFLPTLAGNIDATVQARFGGAFLIERLPRLFLRLGRVIEAPLLAMSRSLRNHLMYKQSESTYTVPQAA